jgi:hypothetical protein
MSSERSVNMALQKKVNSNMSQLLGTGKSNTKKVINAFLDGESPSL